MAVVSQLVGLVFQFLDNFAFLILSAIGLAVIFGMMGVINLAHGAFIVIGAYATVLSVHQGIPLPAAMAIGVVATIVLGLVIERLVIRHLYGRLLDSMVATWGIALIVQQGLRNLFGASLASITIPFGTVTIGSTSYSGYRLFLSIIALLLLIGLYLVFSYTRFGIKARATIQNDQMADSLGINTQRMYVVTFALGSGLAGLTGALYSPTLSIVPGLGSTFLVEAFVTVIVGGSSILVGMPVAGVFLGAIYSGITNFYGTFIGRIGLLVVTIIIIRIAPQGMTQVVEKLRRSINEE